MTDYIRIGVDKLEFNSTSYTNADIWHTGNFTPGNYAALNGSLAIDFNVDTLTVDNNANISGLVTITANDVDFIVKDTTDAMTNFIFRDWSAGKLNLGTPTSVVTLRSDILNDTANTHDIGSAASPFNYVYASRLYIGPDGSDGYFYSDAAGRTAFSGAQFYIQATCSTFYNYATTMYHGNTTGDAQLFRGNDLSGDDWSIAGASGNIITTGYINADYFRTNTGKVLGIYESGWGNQTTHTVLYNGYRATLGDYLTVRASGNSTSGHGALIVADQGLYYGTHDDETGTAVDSATVPLSTTKFYVNSSGSGFFDGDITIGDGTADSQLHIKKLDTGASDHIIFYNGTTRIGEIGCHDTTWLRINQTTSKNIYTPRYIRADAGFFVDDTSHGILGTGILCDASFAGTYTAAVTLNNAGNALTGSLAGNASTATTFQTARTINGVSFNGSAGIVVEPYISSDDTGDTNCPILFSANSTAGYKRIYEDSALYFDNTNNILFVPQVNLGTVRLTESTHRAELLKISSTTTGWSGVQIGNDTEDLWNFMADGNSAGIYNDTSNEWHIQCIDNAQTTIYYNGVAKIASSNTGSTTTGTVAATVGFNISSDLRKKIVHGHYENKNVKEVDALWFDFKDGSAFNQLGYGAQHIEKWLPEAVDTDPETYFKTVNYTMVHTAKLAELESEVNELKILVQELLSRG